MKPRGYLSKRERSLRSELHGLIADEDGSTHGATSTAATYLHSDSQHRRDAVSRLTLPTVEHKKEERIIPFGK